MTGRITIEASEASSLGVPIGVPHLYLVYQDLGNGREYVIRAGPERAWGLFGSEMKIETNVPIEDSADDRGGDSPADRASTDLAFPGVTDDRAWSIMVKYCRALAAADYPYDVLRENSNAFVGAMLHAAGGVPGAMLPTGVSASEAIGFSYWDDIVADVLPPADGIFRGTAAADVLAGLQMDEVFHLLAGNDRVACGRGNDLALGGAGSDTISGEDGGDNLRGGSEGDRLTGGPGNDTLAGELGGDLLVGGAGSDSLVGGAGADTFHFAAKNGADTIVDFEDGLDRIRIDAAAVDSLDDLHPQAVGPDGMHLRLAFDGTAIIVRGLDLADFGAADVVLLHGVLTG